MITIKSSNIDGSPNICSLQFNGVERFAITVNEAIALRNKLTEVINEHQKGFSEVHISNTGNVSDKK